MLEVNRLYKARIVEVQEWIPVALQIQSAFVVNIVTYQLFPIRKITNKPVQAFIFYSIVRKLF